MSVTVRATVKKEAFVVGVTKFDSCEMDRIFIVSALDKAEAEVKEKIEDYNKEAQQSAMSFVGPIFETDQAGKPTKKIG